MEPFEYAIKKDVRNNPIVREVDEARQRDLWKSVGLAGFLVVVLLFSAWQHFELLRHGYQIEQINRERAIEEEAGHQLRLEIDTLQAPKRIEALAIGGSGSSRPLLTKPSCSSASSRRIRRQNLSSPNADERSRIPVARHAEAAARLRRRIHGRVGGRRRGAARLSADLPSLGPLGARRPAAVGHASHSGQARRHRRSPRPPACDQRRRRFHLRGAVRDRQRRRDGREAVRCDRRLLGARSGRVDRAPQEPAVAFRLRAPAGIAAGGATGRRVESAGRRVHQGEPALLSRTRSSPRTCSATSASMGTGSKGSSGPTTRRFAARPGRS